MANPEVLHASVQLRDHDEASPNLPGVWATISRPRAVTVRFLNDGRRLGRARFRRALGHLGPAPDRPSERPDVFRPPVEAEARPADQEGGEGTQMRLVFMGSPAFSVPVLDALVAAGHEIAAVYCQPPRPAGRGKKDRPTPVHARALELGLEVRHPKSLRTAEAQAEFAGFAPELAVVVAYGLILPQAILDAPRRGCLNIHASLLPRWRGAAPIHRAIMAGDAETGVCIMQMDAGLDTGPVLLRKTPRDRAGGDHRRAARPGVGAGRAGDRRGARPARRAGTASRSPTTGVTYAEKIDKAEARVDWTQPGGRGRPADPRAVARSRAPGARSAGERVKLLGARLAAGSGGPGTVDRAAHRGLRRRRGRDHPRPAPGQTGDGGRRVSARVRHARPGRLTRAAGPGGQPPGPPEVFLDQRSKHPRHALQRGLLRLRSSAPQPYRGLISGDSVKKPCASLVSKYLGG